MDESLPNAQPQAETPALSDQERQALQQKLAEGHATIAAQNESDVKALGEIGSKPIVTAGGEVQTPGDRAAELQTREVQGHAYQQ